MTRKVIVVTGNYVSIKQLTLMLKTGMGR